MPSPRGQLPWITDDEGALASGASEASEDGGLAELRRFVNEREGAVDDVWVQVRRRVESCRCCCDEAALPPTCGPRRQHTARHGFVKRSSALLWETLQGFLYVADTSLSRARQAHRPVQKRWLDVVEATKTGKVVPAVLRE